MLGCSLQSSTADAISSRLLTLHDTDTLTQPTNNTKNSTKKILISRLRKAAPLYLYVTYYFYRLESPASFNSLVMVNWVTICMVLTLGRSCCCTLTGL